MRGAGVVGILPLGRRAWLLRDGDRCGCNIRVLDSRREEVKGLVSLG